MTSWPEAPQPASGPDASSTDLAALAGPHGRFRGSSPGSLRVTEVARGAHVRCDALSPRSARSHSPLGASQRTGAGYE